MAESVKAHATKPDDPSSIHRIHTGKENKAPEDFCDLHEHTVVCEDTQTNSIKNLSLIYYNNVPIPDIAMFSTQLHGQFTKLSNATLIKV